MLTITYLYSYISVPSYLNRIKVYDVDTSSIIKQIKPSIFTIKIGESGTGFGFVVSHDGYFVTNGYVMKDKSALAIFSDGFKTEVKKAEARKKSLAECLQSATNQYQGTWNEYCKKSNQQDNCALPSNIGNVLEQRHSQMRN
jgi:hypothetical protein